MSNIKKKRFRRSLVSRLCDIPPRKPFTPEEMSLFEEAAKLGWQAQVCCRHAGMSYQRARRRYYQDEAFRYIWNSYF